MKCKYKSMYWSCTIATRILGPIRIATGLFLYCSYICFISIQHFLKHFDHFCIKKNTCSFNPSLPWNPVVLDNFRKYFSLQKPPSPWNLQWPWGGGVGMHLKWYNTIGQFMDRRACQALLIGTLQARKLKCLCKRRLWPDLSCLDILIRKS